MLLYQAKMMSLPSNPNSKDLILTVSSTAIRFHNHKFYITWIESVLEQIIFSLSFFPKQNQEKRSKKERLTGILDRTSSIWRKNLLKSSKWRNDRKKLKNNHKSILRRSKSSSSNFKEFSKKAKKWENKQWNRNKKTRSNYKEKSENSKPKS